MKKRIPQAVAMILLATALQAQDVKPTGPGTGATPVRAQAEVSSALNNFLAHVDDPAAHENWWADDLVYTGSTGAVKTKPEIVKSVREGAAKALPPHHHEAGAIDEAEPPPARGVDEGAHRRSKAAARCWS